MKLLHTATTLSPSTDMVKPKWMYSLIILISTLAFFLLPMLIISILYLLIGLRLHRDRVITTVDSNHSFGPESVSRFHQQKLSKRNLQVTKMLCTYYLGFFFFYTSCRNFKLPLCVCVCTRVCSRTPLLLPVYLPFLSLMPICLRSVLSSATFNRTDASVRLMWLRPSS